MSQHPSETTVRFIRCLRCQKIFKTDGLDNSALLNHIRTDHPHIEIITDGTPNANQYKVDSANLKEDSQSSRQKAKKSKAKLCPAEKEVGFDDEEINKKPIKKEPIKKESIKKDPKSETTDYEDSPRRDDFYTRTRPACKANENEQEQEQQQQQDGGMYCASATRILYLRNSNTNTNAAKKHSSQRRLLYRTTIENWRPAKGTIFCPKCANNKRPLIKSQSERLTSNSCCASCIMGCWPLCFLPIFHDTKEFLYCSKCQNFLGLYDRQNNCVRPNREYANLCEKNLEMPDNIQCCGHASSQQCEIDL